MSTHRRAHRQQDARTSSGQYHAQTPNPGKVAKVMGEFKAGTLRSSAGPRVTNRRQAIAIALSEARRG